MHISNKQKRIAEVGKKRIKKLVECAHTLTPDKTDEIIVFSERFSGIFWMKILVGADLGDGEILRIDWKGRVYDPITHIDLLNKNEYKLGLEHSVVLSKLEKIIRGKLLALPDCFFS